MPGPVRSVSQAFAILRLLSSHPAGLTLSAIARELGLSPSSCLNLLRTLVAEGMAERGGAEKLYRAAAAWDRLDFARGAVEQVIARVMPAMRAFAQDHEATVGLWYAVSNARLELVALAESGAATSIHMVVGQRQPIGGGATGRALAASEGLSVADLRRRYDAVRWATPLTFADYARQVERAATAGYAFDNGFGHAGICSFGAKLGGTGPARFCLSASVFAGSLSEAGIVRVGEALASLAASA
ncbi:IclR family transcriptional regulator [Novosphingobium sp.]|uniref:IclR family transcriptional regulator n=1 Tax=Novosphingobium sp. TaxID=1874826 RepID=UPI0035B20667